MRAVSRQWQQFRSNRFATPPFRRTLAGAKNFASNQGKSGSRIRRIAPLQARVTRHSAIGKERGLGNTHRSTSNLTTNIQLQESLIKAGVISSVQQNVLCEGGFASIVPLDHPLVMVYISSCQQGNRMIYVSPQIANLGFAQELWLEKADLRLLQVHDGDREQLAQALQNSCRTGEKFNCQYRLYDGDGKIHWFHDEASVVLDESGTPLFIRGIMLDITGKKEMEAELDWYRYHLERHVESRAEQLLRRVTLLESCNTSLSDKLALAKQELTTLKQQKAAVTMRTAQATPLNDCIEQTDVISNLARNMIKWRVAAAGAIT